MDLDLVECYVRLLVVIRFPCFLVLVASEHAETRIFGIIHSSFRNCRRGSLALVDWRWELGVSVGKISSFSSSEFKVVFISEVIIERRASEFWVLCAGRS